MDDQPAAGEHGRRDIDRLVVYGTLRSGTGWRERLEVDHLVEPVGPCRLRGDLFDLGWYPGFVPGGDDLVVAEVLALRHPDALSTFDRFEGIGVDGPGVVEYRRDEIELAADGESVAHPAWLYVYVGAVRAEQRVPSGDWLVHLTTKSTEHS